MVAANPPQSYHVLTPREKRLWKLSIVPVSALARKSTRPLPAAIGPSQEMDAFLTPQLLLEAGTLREVFRVSLVVPVFAVRFESPFPRSCNKRDTQKNNIFCTSWTRRPRHNPQRFIIAPRLSRKARLSIPADPGAGSSLPVALTSVSVELLPSAPQEGDDPGPWAAFAHPRKRGGAPGRKCRRGL